MQKIIPILILISIFWVGCGDSVNQNDDISELLSLIDNDFMLKLDLLDEGGAIDEEYTDGLDVDGGYKIMADTLWPNSDYRLRFGRHILNHERDVSFDIQDDTAYADISRSISGNFFVVAFDSNHTMVDSFMKAFDSDFSRRVRFTRNDSSSNRPWRVDAFTIGTGGSGSKVSITSLACYDYNTGDTLYYYSASDVGDIFILRSDVPSFAPRDSVRIEISVANEEPVFLIDSLDSGEKATLNFGRGRGERARRRFNDSGLFGDETAGDNVFTMIWRAHRLHAHHGNRRAFNTHFDIIDNATLFISDGGYNVAVWSIPYRIVRP